MITQNKTRYDEMFNWRIMAYQQFHTWLREGKQFGFSPMSGSGVKVLAEVLGYANPEECKANMTDADVEIIKALIGPHGWAIYKALMARQGAGE